MKKYLLFLCTVMLFLLAPAAVSANTGRYIVTLENGAEISGAFENKYGLEQLTEIDHGVYITNEENAERLERLSIVESVSETHTVTLSAEPDDTYYVNGNQWALSMINANYARNFPCGKKKVNVVVIDTGYDFDHEDKGGNIIPGKDYLSGSTVTKDRFTHGTACAGIIGAATGNGKGIAGMNPYCTITVLSVFYDKGKHKALADDADIIAAIYDAVDVYHADVISMSFGGTVVNGEMYNAVRHAINHKAILVAAVGNGYNTGNKLEYPAAYSEVIGVTAVTSTKNRADAATVNGSVFVSAPGKSIITTANPDDPETEGEYYRYFTGTSAATPFVASLAAYAKSINPNLTQDQFKAYLKSTSTDLGTAGYDMETGYGLINCQALLNKVLNDSAGSNGLYYIRTASDLSSFCSAVSAGQTSASAYLLNDITAESSFQGASGSFCGLFCGGGHTISGLTVPLFEAIGSGGEVRCLTVSGDISGSDTAFITRENSGTILSCFTKGSIRGTSTAGVCCINKGDITGCVNSAEITGSCAGGIAVSSLSGSISHCGNTGTVSASPAGGICPSASGTAVRACYNSGSVNSCTGAGIIAVLSGGSSMSRCYYQKALVPVSYRNTALCEKNSGFMKTRGFASLRSEGAGYLGEDCFSENGGYPAVNRFNLPVQSFTDVGGEQWHANYIYTLAANGIVYGKTLTQFDPDATISRAEFLTILFRTADVNPSEYNYTSKFTDVKTDKWYTAAVNWATESHITYGISSTVFGITQPVSRQEIACFLTRYSKNWKGWELPAAGALAYKDRGSVAVWAKDSVSVLSQMGVISGYTDNTFRPLNPAMRSEASKLIAALLYDEF